MFYEPRICQYACFYIDYYRDYYSRDHEENYKYNGGEYEAFSGVEQRFVYMPFYSDLEYIRLRSKWSKYFKKHNYGNFLIVRTYPSCFMMCELRIETVGGHEIEMIIKRLGRRFPRNPIIEKISAIHGMDLAIHPKPQYIKIKKLDVAVRYYGYFYPIGGNNLGYFENYNGKQHLILCEDNFINKDHMGIDCDKKYLTASGENTIIIREFRITRVYFVRELYVYTEKNNSSYFKFAFKFGNGIFDKITINREYNSSSRDWFFQYSAAVAKRVGFQNNYRDASDGHASDERDDDYESYPTYICFHNNGMVSELGYGNVWVADKNGRIKLKSIGYCSIGEPTISSYKNRDEPAKIHRNDRENFNKTPYKYLGYYISKLATRHTNLVTRREYRYGGIDL